MQGRHLPGPGRGGTRFPFIELMDEIWRVLAHDGRLYALTPAHPHPDAFVEPTQVNVITGDAEGALPAVGAARGQDALRMRA